MSRKHFFFFLFFLLVSSRGVGTDTPRPDTIFDPEEPLSDSLSNGGSPQNSRFASGIVTTDILGAADTPRGINLGNYTTSPTSAETIFVVGHANNGSTLSMAIAKYSFDGGLDTAFSTNGRLTATPTAQDNLIHGAFGTAPAYFVGRAGTAPVKQLIGRVTTGGLDTAFFTSGIRTNNITGQTEILRGVSRGVSSVIAAGYAWTGSRYDALVVAYTTSSGALNTAFNTVGYRTIALSNSDNGALAISNNAAGVSGAILPYVIGGPVYNGSNWDFGLARLTTDGAMDTTFNTSGINTFAILSGDDKNYSILMEETPSSILAAGYANNGTNNDFAIARLRSDGILDTTFNTTGKVTTTFFTGSDVAFAVTRNDFTGTIYALGSTDNGTDLDIALARYVSSGRLDTSFDTDGKATFDIAGGRDLGNGLKLINFSHALFVSAEVTKTNSDFALLRLETDGSLALSSSPEKSFGTNGVLSFNVSGNDSVSLVGSYGNPISPLGLGMSGSHFFVSHLGASQGVNPGYPGRGLFLNTSFNTRGFVELNAGGGAENLRGVQSYMIFGGAYTLVGDNGSDWLIANLLAQSSSMNTSFNTSGWKTMDFSGNDAAFAVSVFIGTNIFVAGRDGATPSNTVVAEFLNNGSLDTTFFTAGFRTLAPTANSSAGLFVDPISVTATNRVVVAGNDTQDLFVYMLSSGSGSLSTSFNTAGLRVINAGGNEVLGGAYINTSASTLLLAGGNGTDFLVAKVLLANGNIDTSFNTTGITTIDFGTTGEMARGILPERYGLGGARYYVGGDDGTNFLIARILPNGNLDTSFNTNGKRAYPLTGASTVKNMFINNNVDVCVAGSTNGNTDAVILCVNP